MFYIRCVLVVSQSPPPKGLCSLLPCCWSQWYPHYVCSWMWGASKIHGSFANRHLTMPSGRSGNNKPEARNIAGESCWHVFKGQVLLRWPKQLLQPLNRCNLQTWVESLLILVKSFSPPQKTVWDDEEWTQPQSFSPPAPPHHHHHHHHHHHDHHHHHHLDVLVLFLSLVLHHHCQPENFPHQNVAMELQITKSPWLRQVFAALSYDAGDFDRKLGQWWWRALRHDRKANG